MEGSLAAHPPVFGVRWKKTCPLHQRGLKFRKTSQFNPSFNLEGGIQVSTPLDYSKRDIEILCLFWVYQIRDLAYNGGWVFVVAYHLECLFHRTRYLPCMNEGFESYWQQRKALSLSWSLCDDTDNVRSTCKWTMGSVRNICAACPWETRYINMYWVTRDETIIIGWNIC